MLTFGMKAPISFLALQTSADALCLEINIFLLFSSEYFTASSQDLTFTIFWAVRYQGNISKSNKVIFLYVFITSFL